VTKDPAYKIFNLDALTYAGNLENLKDIENSPDYHFEKVNILDEEALKGIFQKYNITDVIHLAAESHVDRSIISLLDFVYTNVIGTVNLLNTAKDFWKQDLSYENGFEKLYAYWITVNYREAYNMYTCNEILFNYESPQRGETVVIL
jgi:dTDP-D-glucose 4,6-dehydratase